MLATDDSCWETQYLLLTKYVLATVWMATDWVLVGSRRLSSCIRNSPATPNHEPRLAMT